MLAQSVSEWENRGGGALRLSSPESGGSMNYKTLKYQQSPSFMGMCRENILVSHITWSSLNHWLITDWLTVVFGKCSGWVVMDSRPAALKPPLIQIIMVDWSIHSFTITITITNSHQCLPLTLSIVAGWLTGVQSMPVSHWSSECKQSTGRAKKTGWLTGSWTQQTIHSIQSVAWFSSN